MGKKGLSKNPAWTEKIDPALGEHIESIVDVITCLDGLTKEDAEAIVGTITVGKIKSSKPFYVRDQTVKILVAVFQPFKGINIY